MNYGAIFHAALIFFIIMDSPGNVPLFLSVLKHFDAKTQRRIILREMIIALAVMILFLFFGQGFFSLLKIDQSSLQIAGGIILFIIAIRMVFSVAQDENTKKILREPVIVPLAIPAVAGPGILATISLYGGGLEGNKVTTLIAILIAWGLSLPVLMLSSHLKKILGTNGLVATERLFGYLVVLISAQMALSGLLMIIKQFHT